jgi:hypothetical protein
VLIPPLPDGTSTAAYRSKIMKNGKRMKEKERTGSGGVNIFI